MATVSYKCPNCGGGLAFNPELQKSKCEYCLSEFTVAELEAANQAFERQSADGGQGSAEQAAGPDGAGGQTRLVGYICDSCGAEVVTEETTSATFCYYCHNPVLLTERLTGAFKPDKIIPFSIDKEKAIQIFLKWSKTKKFVPAGFYSSSQLEKITGLYIPYWMADYQADVDYFGKGTNTRTWYAGNMEYTEHKEYVIQRQGKVDIDHVHEVAMKKIDKGLINSITPYDVTQAQDFSMTFLSGFFAEKYDILKEDVQPAIEDRTRTYVSTLVRETIGAYGRVALERSNLNMSLKGWQYTLLPAWILTYQYQGRLYVYAVNGQNGKAFGELPVDKKRLSLASGLLAAGLFVLAVIGGLLIW